MLAELRRHWPEYFMEAAELGLFMISACLVVAALEHPSSPIFGAIESAALRRAFTGIAMGLTAIAIVYSPWGKRSGAHFNPAVTFAFWRLGKVATRDAVFYALAQMIGAFAGVALCRAVLGSAVIAHPAVNYVATLPGASGVAIAFVAEAAMSFGMMSLVLYASNHPSLARATGVLAGALVALYIAVEAPVSGMSMNPARSFGPALASGSWDALWIYFTAPPLGMLAAAELRHRLSARTACAKLHHQNSYRCLFCEFQHRA